MTSAPLDAAAMPEQRRRLRPSGGQDRVFRVVLRMAGAAVLLLMVMVGTFLFTKAISALRIAGWSFLTTEEREPDSGRFGIAAVLTGTVLIATVAIGFAVPLATGMALYTSEYAPPRLRRILINMIDLMAAVPSVVYGLWGFAFPQGHVIGLSRWLATYAAWFPLFRVTGSDPRDPLATGCTS